MTLMLSLRHKSEPVASPLKRVLEKALEKVLERALAMLFMVKPPDPDDNT